MKNIKGELQPWVGFPKFSTVILKLGCISYKDLALKAVITLVIRYPSTKVNLSNFDNISFFRFSVCFFIYKDYCILPSKMAVATAYIALIAALRHSA
jgi:hypothetical protein